MKKIMDFETRIEEPAFCHTADKLSVLQMNVGRRCNLHCKHCHVDAGPDRIELMSRKVIDACLLVYKKYHMDTIDITGGAPEMNPYFSYLLRQASDISSHVIVRTNLVILEDEQYMEYCNLYKELGVEIVCSLPYYAPDPMNQVRGDHTFESAIRVLQKLNQLGYGREKELVLHLVYNPSGAFFAPPQEVMEQEYKQHLKAEYNIDFNNLFTIINNPVGRFGEFLLRTDNYDSYLETLADAFNPDTLERMMCRFQLSVGYDGGVYDCDFNQAINQRIRSGKDIFALAQEEYQPREIYFANHCYACTAGQGSSCGGATQ